MCGGVTGWWAPILLLIVCPGCELLAERSATLVDAGPDLVAAGCLAGGCVECEPLGATTCPATGDAGSGDVAAPACSGGGDCDGVPQDRDPWPTSCNPLLLQESFAKELDDQRWGRSYGKLHIHVKSCGLLEWTAPPHHTLWAWIDEEIGASLDPAALAELRVVPKLRGCWALTLGVNVASSESLASGGETQTRSCVLSFREGQLTLTSRVRHDDGTDSGRGESFSVAGGFVLQNWQEGTTHHCRVVPDSGAAVSLETEITGALSRAGTVKVTVANQDQVAPYVWLWLDSLRIFAP